MPKFRTTIKTSAAIEDVITTAKEKIVLISPYLKLTEIFMLRLGDAAAKKIQITIVYGTKDLNEFEMKKLLAIPGITILYLQNLHAKCYFNEYQLVINSMNMYEFSERNNHEMGVLLTLAKDEDDYKLAVEEAHSFIRNANQSVSIK